MYTSSSMIIRYPVILEKKNNNKKQNKTKTNKQTKPLDVS